MKINTALLVAAFLLITAFLACKKGGSGVSYNMQATIGTNSYSVNNCAAIPLGTSLLIEGLGSQSLNPTYPCITINIGDWNELADTFFFDSSMLHNYAKYNFDKFTYELSASGLVYINTVNQNSISGTFDFICTVGDTVKGTFVAQRKH